jgi:hypothetical protein
MRHYDKDVVAFKPLFSLHLQELRKSNRASESRLLDSVLENLEVWKEGAAGLQPSSLMRRTEMSRRILAS